MEFADQLMHIEARPHGIASLDEHFLVTPNPSVFIIFVEKVACTFIKHLLVQELIGDVSMIEPSYYMDGWRRINLVHALCHEVLRINGRDVLSNPNASVITFCRNPFARFVSAYVDKIVNPPPLEQPYFKWIRRESLFWKAQQARTRSVSSWGDHISLQDFVEYVAAQHPADRDKHWAEQHLLNFADVFVHAEVIRLEELDQSLPQAWQRHIGRPLPPLTGFIRNSSNRTGQMLDEQSAEIIYDMYRRDFELFGYDKSSWTSY